MSFWRQTWSVLGNLFIYLNILEFLEFQMKWLIMSLGKYWYYTANSFLVSLLSQNSIYLSSHRVCWNYFQEFVLGQFLDFFLVYCMFLKLKWQININIVYFLYNIIFLSFLIIETYVFLAFRAFKTFYKCLWLSSSRYLVFPLGPKLRFLTFYKLNIDRFSKYHLKEM